VKSVHLKLEDDVYEGIWKLINRRYVSPFRKFQKVVNELLREALENHKDELES